MTRNLLLVVCVLLLLCVVSCSTEKSTSDEENLTIDSESVVSVTQKKRKTDTEELATDEKELASDTENLETGYFFAITDGTAEITGYEGFETELNIPATVEQNGQTYNVTSIKGNAFTWDNLTSVTIPDSVIYIGVSAFAATNLTTVTIPASVRLIENRIFATCKNLTFIDVATDNPVYSQIDGVLFNKQTKEVHTYPDGKDVATYIIPDGTLPIGHFAFAWNVNLTTITIPASVTSIGAFPFNWGNKLSVFHGSYAHRYAEGNYITYTLIDGEGKTEKVLWQWVGETYPITDNLRLRQEEGLSGTPLFTLPKGTSVKIIKKGNVETIDGIIADWLQVEVVEDTLSIQGEEIKKGTVGWCFGGYLPMAEYIPGEV